MDNKHLCGKDVRQECQVGEQEVGKAEGRHIGPTCLALPSPLCSPKLHRADSDGVPEESDDLNTEISMIKGILEGSFCLPF